MKLGQVTHREHRGVVLVEKGEAFLVAKEAAVTTTRELFLGESRASELAAKAATLLQRHGRPLGSEADLLAGKIADVTLLKPIDPPEVWATGVTYRRQAVAHDRDLEEAGKKNVGLYSYVYQSYRAEVFFKGFDRTTRGPGETVGLRADSRQVLPEAELVAVLGASGSILAYTAGNDLTCWDLELECPLFLSQAKTYDGSCSVGPLLVLADGFDPYGVSARCYVHRQGRVIMESAGHTKDLKRSVEEMAFFLGFNNDVPFGSLLFTGTTCVTPPDLALEDGDDITVELDGIGRLTNRAVRWKAPATTWVPRQL